MTDKQPEALRIANELESDYDLIWASRSSIAAELRRLYWDELRVREHRDQMCAEVTRLHGEVEALRTDAERYRWLRSKSKETLLNPKGAASEFLPDMRTHWQMPVLICSGPIGCYLEFDAAIDAAMKGQP